MGERATRTGMLRRAAAVALVAFVVAVQFENYWDMHMRHVPFQIADWLFAGFYIGLTSLAAWAFPLALTLPILTFYVAVVACRISEIGLSAYIRYLALAGVTASDIFFGACIFIAQTVMLLGFGTGRLARRLRTSLISR